MHIDSLERDIFYSIQMNNERVQIAFDNTIEDINKLFLSKNITFPPAGIFIRIFKQEEELELWAQNGHGQYEFIKMYPICALCGSLGPKRQEGDQQIPEGFYRIERFNPVSQYHLSLGLNYPNDSDMILSNHDDPGCHIFIHGNCVTVGCIPITDIFIEELYTIALNTFKAGQHHIPVHIFPTYLTNQRYNALDERFADKKLSAFWENLKEGYKIFEDNRLVPDVSVDDAGRYIFKL